MTERPAGVLCASSLSADDLLLDESAINLLGKGEDLLEDEVVAPPDDGTGGQGWREVGKTAVCASLHTIRSTSTRVARSLVPASPNRNVGWRW